MGCGDCGFNYLNSGQYATFLYCLSQAIRTAEGDCSVADRIFLLNKALNGIDLYHEINLPAHFLIGHIVGMVFAKASYEDYLVFHQGCTVVRKADAKPLLENNIVMYPHSMVIGRCHIRENTVIVPGVCLVDTDTPGNCYVLSGKSGRGEFKELRKNWIADYFLALNGRD